MMTKESIKLSQHMKPKRIAIIAGQLVVGGAEQQLYLWLSHLDRDRFQPVVLTLHPNKGDHWEPIIESLGIPLLRIHQRRLRLIRLLDITRVLFHYHPHLIHGWHLFASPYAGMTAKILGARSLGGVRGSYSPFASKSLEALLTLATVDGIVVNSETTARQIRTFCKWKKQRIFSVQNAVQIANTNRDKIRQELSQKYDLPLEQSWIGSLGRLDTDKNFDLIIKALANIRRVRSDFHFLLIGDGPERARLEELAADLKIKDLITFTGEIPGANAWLKALDIFCFASLNEGQPNVVMEASMSGVPIVAWRVPFIEELLEDDVSALLVDARNLGGFEDAILKLLTSRQLRNKIGRHGRACMQTRFPITRYIEQMTSVYEEILEIEESSIPSRL